MDIEIVGKRVDPEAAWRLVGDTDQLNRLVSGPLDRIDLQPREAGYPAVRGRYPGDLGPMPFEEVHNAWARHRRFVQVRTLERVILSSRYDAQLEPDGDGVRPSIRLSIEPRYAILKPALAMNMSRMRRAWQAAVDGLPEPGRLQAWDPVSVVKPRELSDAARSALVRWRDTGVQSGLSEQVASLLQHGRPRELGELRPFALADSWRMSRAEVLDGFLSGVQAGLFELYWAVTCPRCFGQTATATALSDLPDHAGCPSCRLEFDADLGETVEARFAPHPSVAARSTEAFCTLYPAGAPQIAASFLLQPGAAEQMNVALPEGAWHLVAPGLHEPVRLDARGDAGASPLRWRASLTPTPTTVRSGDVAVDVHNDSRVPVRVSLIQASPPSDRVPASLLATRPGFRRSFHHAALSRDVRLAVREVTLLFTDLSGSTALYEELGDAAAYAVVRDHFDLLRAAIRAHGGDEVKTIGDAIMAAFLSPTQAVSCAVAMQREFARWVAGQQLDAPVALKVGLHAGPAFVVQGAGGIDYFGGTVNLAARSQGRAGPGEIVWTGRVQDDPEVQGILRQADLAAEPFAARLKGLRGDIPLYRLTVTGRSP